MKHEIAAVLRDDHAQLARLARELRGGAREALASLRFKQFAAALGGHLSAIEKIVYPALKSVGWKNVNSELLVWQAQLGQAFAELLTLNRDSLAFTDSLGDLLDATERLLEREQRDLLPLLATQLDAAQRLNVGLEAQRYLAPPADPNPAPERVAASEWLEEARLLLGGRQGDSRGASL